MEHGDIERMQVKSIAAYVAAIGGHLRLVADFDQATTRFVDYTDALTAPGQAEAAGLAWLAAAYCSSVTGSSQVVPPPSSVPSSMAMWLIVQSAMRRSVSALVASDRACSIFLRSASDRESGGWRLPNVESTESAGQRGQAGPAHRVG
jgi:hypothetical protein